MTTETTVLFVGMFAALAASAVFSQQAESKGRAVPRTLKIWRRVDAFTDHRLNVFYTFIGRLTCVFGLLYVVGLVLPIATDWDSWIFDVSGVLMIVALWTLLIARPAGYAHAELASTPEAAAQQ